MGEGTRTGKVITIETERGRERKSNANVELGYGETEARRKEDVKREKRESKDEKGGEKQVKGEDGIFLNHPLLTRRQYPVPSLRHS
jgi:hypothetical protein